MLMFITCEKCANKPADIVVLVDDKHIEAWCIDCAKETGEETKS